MDARDVCSKVVVFRERLQAIRFRTLDMGCSISIWGIKIWHYLPHFLPLVCRLVRSQMLRGPKPLRATLFWALDGAIGVR